MPENIAVIPIDELIERTKGALRRLAKAVVVITAQHEGKRYAMAATAVSEVSMDPPSMLVCINKTASIWPPLAAGADFCINILHREQEIISRSCSGSVKGEERFARGEWGEVSGTPILIGAQASILCANDKSVQFGSHEVFFGEVKAVLQNGRVMPLVYVDGRYTSAQLGGNQA